MIHIKKLLLVPFIFLAGMISCIAQSGPAIQAKEFSEKCHDENAILLDVRTPKEYAAGHLKGAMLINIFDDNFSEQVAKLDKTKTVYVYCASGGRSSEAQELMLKSGFKNVVNLAGGIEAWKKAGLPVEQ